MTIVHLLAQPVRLDGHTVIFDRFCETDPVVVASFETAVDVEGHAHQVL